MSVSRQFALLSGELCSYAKEFNKKAINSLIDELNAKPYKAELFVKKQDATALITFLCVNIMPVDEVLCAKASHLINSIVTKQNIQFDSDYLSKVISWHIECIKKCSDMILPDILHNMQCILQSNPHSGQKFINDLIGKQGLLTKIIRGDKSNTFNNQDTLQIHLVALKCVISVLSIDETKSIGQTDVNIEVKEQISQIVVNFLMNGCPNSCDESIYCKIVIAALRVLSHIYFNEQRVEIAMPEVIGICQYFILYGLANKSNKPEKIMPSQQTIAVVPVKPSVKGGKKQKMRKQRNHALQSLKKEVPVSDHSLMKDVDNFENNSAYRPASKNYLEFQKTRTCWTLTSDSDMSDVENERDTKLIALRSRVRQSAANLFLVVFKMKENKDVFGYWWALLPDTPDVNNWLLEDKSKHTLAYAAVTDPIARSRASALSVVLALLFGSRMYLSQAESSKRTNTSFIPFSVSLGYIITCMHKVLINILDRERSHAVVVVAFKCCAALIQATPYHKMEEGLISELVRSTRKYLLFREITLQVGALITIGCILSVDPKTEEILKAMDKLTRPHLNQNKQINKGNTSHSDECDDFEEEYSDDEMFVANEESEITNVKIDGDKETVYFKSWILDICFKNMGWLFRDNKKIRCKPAAIPVILESLQVLSTIAFHHLSELLQPYMTLIADVLSEMLQHEHQDVVVQSAKTISIIGDAIQKLEQQDKPLPINQCVYMWEKLLTPLSSVLQNESVPAKVAVCDCIANIGEKSFRELPDRMHRLCCTLLIGSCSDEEAVVRGAAVRALAMTVMYRSLREDICFVSDCGENILRTLAEATASVRIKAAWALGNLSDALALNIKDPDIEDIDDDLLLRLLEVSIQCANDNDKVKMSATRALGNLLRLIKNENLHRQPQLKSFCEIAIGNLLSCACGGSNMKIRWNACYALGNAMKNEYLFTCFNGWQGKVFTSLCSLAQEYKNLKVRINATVALRAPEQRLQYGDCYVPLWRGIMAAMENAANVIDFNEYKHKDNLIEQLCVTLAHLCCLLKPSDLPDILDPLIFHFDCAKALYTQAYHKLPPENSSCVKILQAAKYITVDLTPENEVQSQSLGMLQEIFIWDV